MKWVLITVIIVAMFSLAVACWAVRRYQRQEQIGSYISGAEEALKNSNANAALQFASKVPETAVEFAKAQDIEARALRMTADSIEHQSNEAEGVTNQIADLRIMRERERSELVNAIPGSPHYSELERHLKELDLLEQKLLQSNELTAHGYGRITGLGRERALVIAYESAVGHPIDSRATSLISVIAEQERRESDASKRRDVAASWQADQVSHGSSAIYSTEGDFDTVLVMQSNDFTNAEMLQRITHIYQRSDFIQRFCDDGFTNIQLKIPGVSIAKIQIPLECRARN